MKEINKIFEKKMDNDSFDKLLNELNKLQIKFIVNSIYEKIDFIDILSMYLYTLKNINFDLNKIKDKLQEYILSIFTNKFDKYIYQIKEEINKINDYTYYYIGFKLNRNISYFHLSRKNIKLYLENYGVVYNYTPYILDDDKINFFMINFAKNKDIDLNYILKILLENDEAILSYSIFQNDDMYNIKYFYDRNYTTDNDIINLKKVVKDSYMNGLEHNKIIIYENLIETYINLSTNILYTNIKRISDKNLLIIAEKHINSKNIKLFFPNGINIKNISKIKYELEEILYDKNISAVFYTDIDFYGLQLLKFLEYKYNIKSSKYKLKNKLD